MERIFLEQGIFISLRFFVIILITTLLTLTTTPIEITDGMEALLVRSETIWTTCS